MLTDAFTAKLRIENLFDKKYEEVPDYPALTRGVFASVEWRF
jgi:vitamin B12 transporter